MTINFYTLPKMININIHSVDKKSLLVKFRHCQTLNQNSMKVQEVFNTKIIYKLLGPLHYTPNYPLSLFSSDLADLIKLALQKVKFSPFCNQNKGKVCNWNKCRLSLNLNNLYKWYSLKDNRTSVQTGVARRNWTAPQIFRWSNLIE